MNELFCKRIKLLRQSNGWSQANLAKHMGLSQQSVAKWEAGQSTPTPDALAKLARLFGITTDYLLGVSDGIPTKRTQNTNIKYALWGGDADEISDEMLEDVKRYAKFIREQKKNEN